MISFSDAITNFIAVQRAGNMSDAQRHATGWFDRYSEAEQLVRRAYAAEQEALKGMACYYCPATNDVPAVAFNAEQTSVCGQHANRRGPR